jgi:hypothetical protein
MLLQVPQIPMDFQGFSRVEYMTIFIALLYAFAVAEFFSGWSKMIRQRDQLTFSVEHIILSFVFFWLLMINWYALWFRIGHLDKGFIYLIISFLPIMIVYLASVFLFPDFERIKDLKLYYEQKIPIIFICIAIFVLGNLVIEYWLGLLQNNQTTYFRIFNPVLMIIAGIFKVKILRYIVLVLFAVGMIGGTVHFAFL